MVNTTDNAPAPLKQSIAGDSHTLEEAEAGTWQKNILSRPLDKVFAGCQELVKHLRANDSPDLCVEAARIFYRLVDSSEEKAACVSLSEAPKLLIEWLASDNIQLVEKALETLARLPNRARRTCDRLVGIGIVPAMCSLFDRDLPKQCLRPVSWGLWHIFQNYSHQIKPEMLGNCLPAISHLLTYREMHVLGYTCRSLLHIVNNAIDLDVRPLRELGIYDSLLDIVNNPQLVTPPVLKYVQMILKVIRIRGRVPV